MNYLAGILLQSSTRENQNVSAPTKISQNSNTNVGYNHRQFAVIKTISSPNQHFHYGKGLPADSRPSPTVSPESQWVTIARRKAWPVPAAPCLSTFQPASGPANRPANRPANKSNQEDNRCLIPPCTNKQHKAQSHRHMSSHRYTCSLPAIAEDSVEPFPPKKPVSQSQISG